MKTPKTLMNIWIINAAAIMKQCQYCIIAGQLDCQVQIQTKLNKTKDI